MPVIARFLFAFALLAASCLGWQPAVAGELSATRYSVKDEDGRTRVQISFVGEPQAQLRLLGDPYRLIVDLPETIFAFDNTKLPDKSLISAMRAGKMHENKSRMIFSMSGPFVLDSYETRPDADGLHHELIITVMKGTESAFRKAVADQLLSTASTTGGKGDRVVQGGKSADFIVVIDPGHGGIDGGATGANGTLEKEVTLSFAADLSEALRGVPNLKVFRTREEDRFIPLGDRIRFARQINGDLFISIHADSITDARLRGATVYTLSEKASDEVAQAVAQNENLADAIGGVDVPVDDHAVADILIDLTRRETTQYSVGFARQVVDALKHATQMINNPHRFAGFRVLKAPDIPSILVELGYLSNVEDEKQISDPAWRKSIAGQLALAIKTHAAMALAARQ